MNAVTQSAPRFAAILVGALLTFATPAMGQDGEDGVAAVLEAWAQTYGSASSSEEMLTLYDSEAVFWGTGGREPFVGAEQIAPYFDQQFSNFTQRRVSFLDPIIRIYDDAAAVTGRYRFEVQTPDGQALDVTHRFSFTLVSEEGEWVIVQQHSSQMP